MPWLRQEFPGLITIDGWLDHDGQPLLQAALDGPPTQLALR